MSDAHCVPCAVACNQRRLAKQKERGARYFGQICQKHPELNGERHVGSGCVACAAVFRKESRRQRTEKHGTSTYVGRVCSEHPEAEGKRWTASDICVECFRLKQKQIRDQRTPQQRMVSNIRIRMLNALRRRSKKAASTEELLGCSIEQLCRHIEQQFQPGMSWENRAEWHVDHIRPLSSFDLSDPEQQREAFHHSNLQPLWAKENLTKHATWYGKAA